MLISNFRESCLLRSNAEKCLLSDLHLRLSVVELSAENRDRLDGRSRVLHEDDRLRLRESLFQACKLRNLLIAGECHEEWRGKKKLVPG